MTELRREKLEFLSKWYLTDYELHRAHISLRGYSSAEEAVCEILFELIKVNNEKAGFTSYSLAKGCVSVQISNLFRVYRNEFSSRLFIEGDKIHRVPYAAPHAVVEISTWHEGRNCGASFGEDIPEYEMPEDFKRLENDWRQKKINQVFGGSGGGMKIYYNTQRKRVEEMIE